MGQSQMVVDVTIEANSKTATYSIPENLSVTYAGDVVLSTDKQGLIAEVEQMKNTAERYLSQFLNRKKLQRRQQHCCLSSILSIRRRKRPNRDSQRQKSL